MRMWQPSAETYLLEPAEVDWCPSLNEPAQIQPVSCKYLKLLLAQMLRHSLAQIAGHVHVCSIPDLIAVVAI